MALASVSPGSHTAKSTSVVVPPKMAARLTCSGGALVVWPPPSVGMGQCVCTCGSMPPGMTSLPLASTTRPTSRGKVPGAATATIRSPSTPTSHAPTPSGVTTWPPRITRSSMVRSPLCRAPPPAPRGLVLDGAGGETRHVVLDEERIDQGDGDRAQKGAGHQLPPVEDVAADELGDDA